MKETTERYFDNGGQTIDRYTIIIGSGVYGMSENPTHAQGFNQYCGEVEEFDLSDNEGVGQAIEWGELPEDVQKAILARLDADIVISEDDRTVTVGDWGAVYPEEFIPEDESQHCYLADMPDDLYRRVRERLLDAGLIPGNR